MNSEAYRFTLHTSRFTDHLERNNEKKMNHKDMEVWKESIGLVKEIYKVTRKFPKEETYGLTNQLRRAAISVPSNVAEGAARDSDKEFVRFLYISLGSLSEVETQVIIARELNYVEKIDIITSQVVKVKKLLLGLIKYLKRKK